MAKREYFYVKRSGNLFGDIISFENLLIAAKKAFRGKKDRIRVAQFYFDMEKELLSIQEELFDKTYRPRPLRIFQIREPKIRDIAASDFRDRIVHHAICNKIESVLERSFIMHSYACRNGKGTHRAIRQTQIFSGKYKYYLKCDIKKYFANIDHGVLKEILVRKFKDADLIWLLNIIIDSAKTDQTGKGVPIGSLTSQYFANLYLDKLDHFVKDIQRIKGYLRYMDDFLLFSDEKATLHLLHSSIRRFLLKELKLELKEKATTIAPITEGIPFLGFRIFPNLIRVKHENKRRSLNRLKSKRAAYKAGIISEETFSQSLMSITEHLKIGNTFHLRKDIFDKMFFQV